MTDDLADSITLIARAAGGAIMKYYHPNIVIENKADDSPVTVADREANDLIVRALTRLTPNIPIVAEESVTTEQYAESPSEFWLVDPLDGTKEFIKRNGDFTVNIALIQRGKPVIGVVHPPAQGTAYIGVNRERALFEDQCGQRREIKVRSVNLDHPIIVVSRSHRSAATDEYLSHFKSYEEIPRGSSLKLCAVATGEADLYPRLGRTMEWDIAAGHAVLIAAGGRIKTIDGQELCYGKPGLVHPHFIASGC